MSSLRRAAECLPHLVIEQLSMTFVRYPAETLRWLSFIPTLHCYLLVFFVLTALRKKDQISDLKWSMADCLSRSNSSEFPALFPRKNGLLSRWKRRVAAAKFEIRSFIGRSELEIRSFVGRRFKSCRLQMAKLNSDCSFEAVEVSRASESKPVKERRKRDAERKAATRLNETPEKSDDRRKKDVACKAASRSNETPEKLTDRRKKNAVSQSKSRSTASDEKSAERKKTNAISQARRRLFDRLHSETNGVALRPVVENNIEEHYLGPMDIICNFCGAFHFEAERGKKGMFNICCHQQSIEPQPERECPPRIRGLLTGSDRESKDFRENIRSYNNALAFASMEANYSPPAGPGPFVYRIHDQIYHKIGNLEPEEGVPPSYGQLYIVDAETAARQRAGHAANSGCDSTLMSELADLIARINPYAQSWTMMKEVVNEEWSNSIIEHRDPLKVAMIFDIGLRDDARRYNLPNVNEVAAVFVGDDICDIPKRRIVSYQNSRTIDDAKTKRLRYMSILEGAGDPLIYPVFFSTGGTGYDESFKKKTSEQRVSMRQFYSSLLCVRKYFEPIFYGAKLMQQFCVDAYVKIEENNLNWFRSNQKKIRADQYKFLTDQVLNDSALTGENVGRIVLPSSFEGSERAMKQHYEDAMAIVRETGKPDIFATMTCNPNWREIRDNLFPGQQPSDRPDLAARVFELKKRAFIDDVLKKQIFGRAIAHVWVIEFQKRGLPHCHFIFTLAAADKIKTVEKIDSTIWAFIPDCRQFPRLFEIIKRNHVHGPCGYQNMASSCMVDGICSKHFPKDFRDNTLTDIDGYPLYRRPDDGRIIMFGGSRFADNRFIVPYNPYVSLKYNCHLNIELVQSIKSIKYLFKYAHKGPDRANLKLYAEKKDRPDRDVEVVEDRDNIKDAIGQINEITEYLSCRYLSPGEALWGIFEHRKHAKSHPVTRLAIHLPGQHEIKYPPTATAAEIAAACATQMTTLLAFFDMNAASAKNYGNRPVVASDEQNDVSDTECDDDDEDDESGPAIGKEFDSRLLLYTDFPRFYHFKDGKWNLRVRQTRCIGRMYAVNPTGMDKERFYLRLLLLRRRGVTSFEDLLKDEDGVLHTSFGDAARAIGLLASDMEWRLCLEEAVQLKMPSQLRLLFAMLLIHCDPENKPLLWEDFKAAFSEDYLRRKHPEDVAVAMAYRDINERLAEYGKSLVDFGVPKPNVQLPKAVDDTDYVMEKAIGKEMHAKLNPRQRSIVDAILKTVETPATKRSRNCTFIDGPGGTGKTYLYRAIFHILRGRNIGVVCTAYSGIAANLLPTGRTLHSTFGIPFNATAERCQCQLSVGSERGQLLKEAQVIICDEAPMAPGYMFNAIDTFFRDLMKNELPFGGKIIICGGDFRQILPVVKGGMRGDMVRASIKSSRVWSHFNVVKLTENMRTDDDQQQFADFLLSMGNGQLPTNEKDEITIDESFVSKRGVVHDVYGDRIMTNDIDSMATRAILCTTNAAAQRMNDAVLNLLPGKANVFYSIDELDVESCGGDPTMYSTELINSLTPSGLPSHKLKLKENAVVMLLRNFSVKRGLCNGTRLIVRSWKKHVLHCEIIDGYRRGERVLIPRFQLTSEDRGLDPKFTRRQFPVQLSFAMTINKSQGQTFDRVGILLDEPVFSHGQLYVAFSRVRNRNNITVQLPQPDDQSLNRLIKNIVYTEVINVQTKRNSDRSPRRTAFEYGQDLRRKHDEKRQAAKTANSLIAKSISLPPVGAENARPYGSVAVRLGKWLLRRPTNQDVTDFQSDDGEQNRIERSTDASTSTMQLISTRTKLSSKRRSNDTTEDAFPFTSPTKRRESSPRTNQKANTTQKSIP